MEGPTSSTDPATPSFSEEQCRDMFSDFHQSFRQTFLAVNSFPSRFDTRAKLNQHLNDMADQIVSSVRFDPRSFEVADTVLKEGTIDLCMALWPVANKVDLSPFPSIIQYFPKFKALEDTQGGRKFYRGLRDLYERMIELGSRRMAMESAQAANPDPAGSPSSGDHSDDDDRIEAVDPSVINPSSTSKAPVSTASTAPVGEVIKNDRAVRLSIYSCLSASDSSF